MNKHLKTFMSYLYLITCLLLHRKFGNIINEIVQKYENMYLYVSIYIYMYIYMYIYIYIYFVKLNYIYMYILY